MERFLVDADYTDADMGDNSISRFGIISILNQSNPVSGQIVAYSGALFSIRI